MPIVFLCIPVGSYIIPMDSYGFLRIPLGSYRIPMEITWISIEFVALQSRITPA